MTTQKHTQDVGGSAKLDVHHGGEEVIERESQSQWRGPHFGAPIHHVAADDPATWGEQPGYLRQAGAHQPVQRGIAA